MKHVLTKGFIGGLLGLLLLAGCSNVLLQSPRTPGEVPAAAPAEDPPAEAGTGRLTVTLTGTGAGGGERTLFPSAPVSFNKYELAFTPESGQEGIPPVILTDGASSHTLTLTTGDWTITALAYVSIQGVPDITNGDYVAARGERTVTISPYSAISETIDLRGGIDEGPGVFSYDIAIPGGLDSAALEVLSLEGTPVTSADLNTAASGSFALGSGYYLLKISRVKAGDSAVWVEMIHIYEGWTTEAAGPAYNFIGLGSAAEILGYLGSQLANTASSPYTVLLSGNLDLERDFIKDDDPLGLLYEALDGKYVSLDLSAAAGNIPGAPSYATANSRPNQDKIVSVTLPDTLTAIGGYAFFGCASLASLDLPDTLVSIGSNAFQGCSSLAAIDLSDTLVTNIGESVFYGCSSLASLDLPDTLATIGNYAFYGCSSLAAIDLSDTLVTNIGDSVFYGCSSLASLDLPNNLGSIGRYAFYGCTSLVSPDLPNSIIIIDRGAFESCSSLTAIDLPSSLITIGDEAFGYCSPLVVISNIATPPLNLGLNIFFATSSLAIYVPNGSVTAYQNAARWNEYASKVKPLSELPPSTGAAAGLQISFSLDNTDITLNGGFKLSKSDAEYSSAAINVENSGAYTNFQWLVDDGELAGETGNSVTLEASNYDAGAHWLRVIAEKAGVPYSRELPFAVVN